MSLRQLYGGSVHQSADLEEQCSQRLAPLATGKDEALCLIKTWAELICHWLTIVPDLLAKTAWQVRDLKKRGAVRVWHCLEGRLAFLDAQKRLQAEKLCLGKGQDNL